VPFFQVVAVDFDGTLTSGELVCAEAVDAIDQVRRSGLAWCRASSSDSAGSADAQDLIGRDSLREPAGEEARRVKSVDVVHRDPQLALVLAAVVHAHDVRMPKF
jgi:hypothetical protein